MKKITVLEPGLMTTIQDEGRIGYQSQGVPISGSMDFESMYIANALVGKQNSESVLEATYLGPKLKFHDDMSIAITGADMQPMLNDVCVGMYQTITIKSGDILSFKGLIKGLRTYISFSDKLVCENVYGSDSTYIKAGFGGIEGRKLKSNDVLEFMKSDFNGSFFIEPRSKDDDVIRVMLSYEANEFEQPSVDGFFSSEYELSNDSDRMGMRFIGKALRHVDIADIISGPIIPGTIQIPKSGQPIIMMKDAQTIGGYTRLGCVISRDLDKLAQLKPGGKIRFKMVSLEEAQEVKKKWLSNFEKMVCKLQQYKNEVRSFRVVINSKLYDIKVEGK